LITRSRHFFMTQWEGKSFSSSEESSCHFNILHF
jgi:hypothetical protein